MAGTELDAARAEAQLSFRESPTWRDLADGPAEEQVERNALAQRVRQARDSGKIFIGVAGQYSIRGLCLAIADFYAPDDFELGMAMAMRDIRNGFAQVAEERLDAGIATPDYSA